MWFVCVQRIATSANARRMSAFNDAHNCVGLSPRAWYSDSEPISSRVCYLTAHSSNVLF
jgi:hypothetical protein